MELEFTNAPGMMHQVPTLSLLPELYGRRKGYSKPTYPGFYHVHRVVDYGVLYMDKACCVEFDASLSEIAALGAAFQEMVTHPDDLPRVRLLHANLAKNGDTSKTIAYFQRIKLRKEAQEGYTLVVTSTKLSRDCRTFVCITNTTDQLPVFSIKVCNALNARHKTQKHAKAYNQLTQREKEVFGYLASGMIVKEIANALYRSERTVEQHKKNIYKKLQVNSVAEALNVANHLQLV